MNIRNWIGTILIGCVAISGTASCVKTDASLGFDIVPESEQFITRTVTIPIEKVYMGSVDSLSGYSTQRIVIGNITDDTFGTVRHCSAINLVPATDTVKWGSNTRIKAFHFSTKLDSTFCVNPSEKNAIRSISVHALKDKLDSNVIYASDKRFYKSNYEGEPVISLGAVTSNGTDSLSFDFSLDFAKTFVPQDVLDGKSYTEVIDTISKYSAAHTGIFFCADEAAPGSGRIDFFNVNLESDDSYVVTSGYAELKMTADFTSASGVLRKDVDTSFLFVFGPSSFEQSSTFSAFNSCENSSKDMEGYAEDKILVEGGVGLKPMIEALYLRSSTLATLKDTLGKYGHNDPEKAFCNKDVIVNRATIVLPFEFPADYTGMDFYPKTLNPTMFISAGGYATYAGLTDATVSTENQGIIDRSNDCYRPDVSFHMQSILATPADSTARLKKENIWMLILADETIVTKSQQSSTSAYDQLAYLNYYNSMLYGGYGGYGYGGYGYGGYGGYGDYYDNYYSYNMMMSLYNSQASGSTKTVTSMPDKDRYYNAVLCGPKSATGRTPYLQLTYSILNLNAQ